MVTHLYLAPHFDDAVYSCGGLIRRQTRAGERVLVLTVCAGRPPAGPLSDFAQALHTRWGVTAEAVIATRQAEDAAALRRLGAQAAWLEVPDCIYRRHPVTQAALYASEAALFGSVDAAEMGLAARIAVQAAEYIQEPAETRLYAPLGIGRHVDHQLARLAADQLTVGRAYYEDYPYAAHAAPTPDWAGLAAGLEPAEAAFGEADLADYGAAVADYRSQLSSFWPDEAALREALRRFCARGPGRWAVTLWTPAG